MVNYRVTPYQNSRHRLKIVVTFPCSGNETEFFMSAWRPGRYEEGNFTRLVTHLQVFDDQSKRRCVEKIGKNSWKAECSETEFITVSYLYMGKDLNAGSTYFDENLLLINPVNSLIYNKENDNGITLRLNTPWKKFGISNGSSDVLHFENLDQLFDQPILCANDVKTLEYEVRGVPFFIHLWSMPSIPENRIIADFRAFTECQVHDFGCFPAKEFHFLLLGTPQTYLHGVEHLNSTVIVIGSNQEFTENFYFRLLSVASHELYHVWNVKTLRPKELMPYRYQALNYSRLGYIYEGVTTYLGDIYLLRSGVIDADKYLKILTDLIQTHIDNSGRFSSSVADSSVDTWVDGYVMGTPGRKVSIYNEGALIAFIVDVQLRNCTRNKVRLETFMRSLYEKFAKKSLGYTQQDLYQTLLELSAHDFEPFFNQYVHKANGYESALTEALGNLGLEIELLPASSKFTGATGVRFIKRNQEYVVHSLAEGSPGMTGGLCEDDVLLTLNGEVFTQELAEAFFGQESIQEPCFSVRRNHRMLELTLPMVQRTFYPKVTLQKTLTEDKKLLKNRELFEL
jgi:predicted metalloprotease with PDZ domain